jgi:hypothetical protein
MVLTALRAFSLSEAKNVAAIMFHRTYHAHDIGDPLLLFLHWHRAVHQADAGIGGVAILA